MFKLHRFTIGQRLMFLVALVLVALLAVSAALVYQTRQQLMEGRIGEVRSVSETALSIVEKFHGLQQRGELSEAEAREAAIEAVRVLRYEGDNYVWINDMRPVMVMHPMQPELEGKDLSNTTDPKGVRPFQRFVDTARGGGSGVVHYHWPRPGEDKPAPKISFVQGFAPWGWVLGTGMYVDDLEATFRRLLGIAAAQIVAAVLVVVAAAWLIGRSILGPLNDASRAMARIAEGDGDLTQRLPAEGRDELSAMARSFNRYTEKIQHTVRDVDAAVAELAAAGEELSRVTHETREGIERQQGETEQVATAVNEMSSTAREIANSAESAASAAGEADTSTQSGKATVGEVLNAIRDLAAEVRTTADVVRRLGEHSDAIVSVVDVIKGVADQTNLLALNAAIEAARAGEQGRGFAVVADEVRTLASRTQDSTKEIQETIERLREGAEQAVSAIEHSEERSGYTRDQAEQAQAALEGIVTAVATIRDMNTQIATAAEEQSVVSQEVDRNVVTISDLARQSADSAGHTATASEDLARLGERLRTIVGQFRLQ